jgi:hypothetical protein
MRLRIYVDTSVAGGCEDDEFREHSIRLMEYFATGKFVLVLSNLTVQELAAAPEQVRTTWTRYQSNTLKCSSWTQRQKSSQKPTSRKG